MTRTRTRRDSWITVGLVIAVVVTALNGVVVGYGVLWFQLFGTQPDREDYLVSAGGYGAAAVVLALAVPALLRWSTVRWPVLVAAIGAGLLGLAAISSAVTATSAEQDSVQVDTAWDGIGGVVWGPWTWALVVLGVWSLVSRASSARRRAPGPA